MFLFLFFIFFFIIISVNFFLDGFARWSTKKRAMNVSSSPNTILPNGLPLHTHGSWVDIQCVYREIFEWETYCNEKRFIQLKDNDVVLDIGSNTGMFGVYLARRFPHLRLHCFEPIPETQAFCEKNLRMYAGERYGQSIFCHRIALSNRNGKEQFLYNPFLSMTATLASQHKAIYDIGKVHDFHQWVYAVFMDAAALLPPSSCIAQGLRFVATLFRFWGTRYILIALLSPLFLCFAISSTLRSYCFNERVPCSLQTLTHFLATQAPDIEKIDFIKLDVEGSEEDVLRGMDDSVWSKIQQMAIEVHDVQGRLNWMTDLLCEKGFELQVEQEDWETHKLLHIYTIFARRLQ